MIKAIRYISVLLLAMAGCFSANASKEFSLDDCKQLALANNAKIRNAIANVEAAKEDKRQAFTAYFPTVSATGFAYTTNNGLVSLDLRPIVEFDLLKNGYGGGISAVMPIFAGGQIYNTNRLAETGVEVNRLFLEQSRHEVELTTEQYFWQIVGLQEKERTIAAVEEQLDRLDDDVSTAVDAGIALRNDLLKVQLKKNEIESMKSNLDNNLAVCKMLLAQYAGLDSADFELKAAIDMDSVPDFPFNLRRDHDSALPETPEYRLLEQNVEAGRLEYRKELGKNLPSLFAGASYSAWHNQLFDMDHDFGMLFATVSIPISGWWGGSHAMKKKKIQMENAQRELNDKSDLLKIKMQKSWVDFENAYKQLSIAHKSIAQSAENLRLNNDYYRAGTIATSDLLDAITMAQQSRDKYVEAFSAFQTKKLEYMQAVGM